MMAHAKMQAEKIVAKAEECFKRNKLDEASRLALKAHSLCPSLSGLKQTLVAYHVHLVAAKNITGTTTYWHAILGTKPSDDIQIIKKQYKKMCMLTHPDKNTSNAADGAFKLISGAWQVLSTRAGAGTQGSPADGQTSGHPRSNTHEDCSGRSNAAGGKNAKGGRSNAAEACSGDWTFADAWSAGSNSADNMDAKEKDRSDGCNPADERSARNETIDSKDANGGIGELIIDVIVAYLLNYGLRFIYHKVYSLFSKPED